MTIKCKFSSLQRSITTARKVVHPPTADKTAKRG
eukprot:CAMPEP_0178807440 /NCGR_PEP_ID=MMETSP0745-20121128/16935_1 /TAXON_ID=913974 /ORGANISM="Nitzschia punctata, Strain CCMP561" /LENGTH=33 /DNA_ID= /DNA_START= /DNA_END= /DNA_ORIENTATION=